MMFKPQVLTLAAAKFDSGKAKTKESHKSGFLNVEGVWSFCAGPSLGLLCLFLSVEGTPYWGTVIENRTDKCFE